MRIGRTIPPAASPLYLRDIFNGLKALVQGARDLDRFQLELKAYFGVRHCFLLSSGKAALTVILKALHSMYPERNEVLIPAYCCYSVPSAIVRAGLKIRLCDIDPETLDFDYDQLERGVYGVSSERLLAVIPVNLFGLAADVDRVRNLILDSQIHIIEDSAQALGATPSGRKLGTRADIGFFSLGRSKPISTVEGGIIITDRDDIAIRIESAIAETPRYSRLELLKIFLQALALILFQRPSLFWFPKTLPFLRVGDTIYDPEFKIRRFSAFQAGLAKNWGKKLSDFERVRKNTANQLKQALDTSLMSIYSGQNGIEPHHVRFPIRIQEAKLWQRLVSNSEALGLGIMPTYPDSINGISELRGQFARQNFRVARDLTGQLLTIPVHPLLADSDKRKIISNVNALSKQVDMPG